MPGLRALASSTFAGVVVFLVADLWFRWPGFVAVAVGALFGVSSLILTASLETRGAAADEAWRAAAPDLAARAAASTDPEAGRRRGGADPPAGPSSGKPAGSAPGSAGAARTNGAAREQEERRDPG